MYEIKKDFKILAIEDNMGDFTLIEDYLTEKLQSLKLLHAQNFKTANIIIDDHQNSLDVILLDISLPDKDGEDLVKSILEKAKATPVIVLTGNTNIEFSIKSITYGVADYLVKDNLTADILLKSILYAIEREKINQQLKLSEKKFSDLFYLNPQPMFVVEDATKKIVQVNSAALELYKYTEQDFLSLQLVQLFDKKDILTEDITILNFEKYFTGRHIHTTKLGESLIVELYSKVVNDYNTPLIYISVNDITDKIRIDETITKAIIKTQEDERFEIGGELHDNICQILAASKMFIGLLKPHLSKETLPLLNNSKDAIDSAIKEIRNLSHRLAPTFFDETSIADAFIRLFSIYSLDNQCTYKTKIDKNISTKKFNRDIQINLYRILQEQLRNIQKYSLATTVEFEFRENNNQLIMRTKDNGKGFLVNESNSGIGLSNMKRRAELLNGTITINSLPEKGTEIIVIIPVNQ
jgi:PAS domain S-box-containing protein